MKNTKLYKFLFEQEELILSPETSAIIDDEQEPTDDSSYVLEGLEDDQSQNVAVAAGTGEDVPEGKIITVSGDLETSKLVELERIYDDLGKLLDDASYTEKDELEQGKQVGMQTESASSLAENRLKKKIKSIIANILNEADREGIGAQQKIADDINALARKARITATAESNTKGSTLPDIVVKNAAKNKIAQFECKSAQGAQTEVSFFDRTVSTGGIGAKVFGDILKQIAIINKLKFFQKKGSKFIETKQPSNPQELADAMITRASAASTAKTPDCGKYGDLDGPEWNDIEWYSVEDQLGTDRCPKQWRGKSTTQLPVLVNGKVKFKYIGPTSTGRKGETGARPNRLYVVSFDSKGNAVYKYVTIKNKKITKNDFLVLDPGTQRGAGDSGSLKSNCFRVTKLVVGNAMHDQLRTVVAGVITQHFIDGKDNYFAIVKSDNIYLFRTTNENPLKLRTEDDEEPPVFGPDRLLSAGLGTYGTGGPDQIRMTIKCHVDLTGVPPFSSKTYTMGKWK